MSACKGARDRRGWHEIYREAGGTKLAKVARRRIKRVADLRFEEVLIGSQFDAIERVERVRNFLGS